MRICDPRVDSDLIREISPDRHMRKSVNYLRFAQHNAPKKFYCLIEPQTCYIAFIVNKDSIRILSLAVSPQNRSAGIGSRTVEYVEKLARRLQKSKITARTDPEGRQFLFYIRLGFVVKTFNESDVELELSVRDACQNPC